MKAKNCSSLLKITLATASQSKRRIAILKKINIFIHRGLHGDEARAKSLENALGMIHGIIVWGLQPWHLNDYVPIPEGSRGWKRFDIDHEEGGKHKEVFQKATRLEANLTPESDLAGGKYVRIEITYFVSGKTPHGKITIGIQENDVILVIWD